MKIKNFVIHHVLKAQHSLPVLSQKHEPIILWEENGALTKQGELIQSFVGSAVEMFDRQRSGKVFADIKKDGNTFADQLSAYLARKVSFSDFSYRIAQELVKQMESVSLATGGYMAISTFESSPEKLLILMIRQEQGYAIDPKTLELKESLQLDLQTINTGVIVDLAGFLSGEENHLTLVKGLKSLSTYFRSFLGVENYKSPKDQTDELKVVIEKYMDQYSDNFPAEQRAEVKRKVANLLRDQKEDVTSLDSIGSQIQPDDPEKFRDFANNQGVSMELNGDPNSIKGWLRVRYKNPTLSLDFDKSTLDKFIIWKQEKDILEISISKFEGLKSELQKAQQ